VRRCKFSCQRVGRYSAEVVQLSGELHSLMFNQRRPHIRSRRGFLKRLLAALVGGYLPRSPRPYCLAALQSSGKFPFELVPPAVSGITWVHHNGRSPEMYLPETVGAGCAFIDYDNDGKLDLFICRFVDFDKSKNKFCGNPQTGQRYYCIPRVYDPMPSWLFHNNGDGTFTDVSHESGISKSLGKAWGVVACDINND